MSVSFAIIGPKNSQNTKDLIDSIHSTNNNCSVYGISDMYLSINTRLSDTFFDNDIFIFRGYNKALSQAHTLAMLLNSNKKIVIDNFLINHIPYNKLQSSIILEKQNISQPKLWYARTLKNWKKITQHITLPVIIKILDGQQGSDIYKFDTLQKLLFFLEQHQKQFFIQEYIQSDGDVRVFIVGNKILGAIKRFIIKDDFRSNASLGANVIPFKLSKKIANLAMKAHQSIGYDISGVDIIFDKNNNPYILEINHTPQWQALKKTIDVNPSQEIINFALQQYEEKNRIL